MNSSWLQTEEFSSKFRGWIDAVKQRSHLCLGYGRQAGATASKIKDSLTSKAVSVMDGMVDLQRAAPAMDELDQAARSCMGSIFLFTKDDETRTREALLYEAGYFIHAKGMDKTLIIREEGADIPANLGGITSFPLPNAVDIAPLEKDFEQFIVKNP